MNIGVDAWSSVDAFLNLQERNTLSRVSRDFNRRQQQYLDDEKRKAARAHVLKVLEASDDVNDDIWERDIGTKYAKWFDASFDDLGIGYTLVTYGTPNDNYRERGFEQGTWTVRLQFGAEYKELRLDLDARALPLLKQFENPVAVKWWQVRPKLTSAAQAEAAEWVVNSF